jgi:hypothetical protein
MLNKKEKEEADESGFSDSDETEIAKITAFEKTAGINSVTRFWMAKDDEEDQEWRSAFTKFVKSRSDISLINSVVKMEKACLVGCDKSAFDYWASNADRTRVIVLADSKNESLDSVISECNFRGIFVQVYAKFGENIKKSKYKGASYCFCDNPKTEMLESSDKMILLTTMTDLDWVCKVNPCLKVENALAQLNDFRRNKKEEEERRKKADMDAALSNSQK